MWDLFYAEFSGSASLYGWGSFAVVWQWAPAAPPLTCPPHTGATWCSHSRYSHKQTNLQVLASQVTSSSSHWFVHLLIWAWNNKSEIQTQWNVLLLYFGVQHEDKQFKMHLENLPNLQCSSPLTNWDHQRLLYFPKLFRSKGLMRLFITTHRPLYADYLNVVPKKNNIGSESNYILCLNTQKKRFLLLVLNILNIKYEQILQIDL